MTKEELKKATGQELIEQRDYCGRDNYYYEYLENINAEMLTRFNRLIELEAQIEKMKCCGNCAKRGHICVAEEMQGNLCGKNKDKWELRR